MLNDNAGFMTYALFDDAGKFHAGRVMTESDASLQVELDSGKRVKVKAANVLMKFEQPAPAELMSRARTLADDIDLELAWEFAPEGEFGFADLARDYFDAKAGVEKQAAALVPPVRRAALLPPRRQGPVQESAGGHRQGRAAGHRAQEASGRADRAPGPTRLAAGQCPPPVREQLYRILFKPDKNAPEYKAVVEAAKRPSARRWTCCKAAGAINSAYQFHWQRFPVRAVPEGHGFPAGLAAPAIRDTLPLAPCRRSRSTIQRPPRSTMRCRCRAWAAARWCWASTSPRRAWPSPAAATIDKVAAQRLSTVYMPGWKLTMLPDDVVQAYTLTAGRDCPAVSLYVTFDESTLEVTGHETRLERVPIVANLRHDQLDAVITAASLTGEAAADYPFAAELAFAFRLAQTLKARREVVRGKPENFNRPDYNFKLDNNGGDPNEAPRATSA